MAYKEYKRVLKSEHITNYSNFSLNLQNFLDENPDIKIIDTIVHKAYHVTIIYQELIPL